MDCDAGDVATGPQWYEVTYPHAVKGLKVGDRVRVEYGYPANAIIRVDSSRHPMMDEHGQYVHLRKVDGP